MDAERQGKHESADRYLAAVAAAGQAVIAVRSGMGVSEAGIKCVGIGEESPYRAVCIPRRLRGAASALRFLMAGEAAQEVLGLMSFPDINFLSQHRTPAEVIRAWHGYWGLYPPIYAGGDSEVDAVEEEIKTLIWLTRWQVRRRFLYDPERSAIESLALKIRDRESLTGAEAERFVRRIR